MKIPGTYQAILKRSGQIIAFTAAILAVTALTFKSGTIANSATVAFVFLIIVLFSAYFGTLLVATVTSAVATLCFDYFYLPPFGTLNIASFPDWISLAAFLLTAAIISRLTSSAAENKVKADNLDASLVRLKEFGMWLMSMPGDQLTLSKMTGETLRIFSLEYCSIHVYGEGKWRHFTGSAASPEISHAIEAHLDIHRDHKHNLMEIVDENMLNVRYMNINDGKKPLAILVVKTKTLSTDTIGVIAGMMGIRMMEIIKDRATPDQNAA